MTDIRRSILWIVFSVSLVMLWDAWNTHNGHPSMFAPQVAKPVAAGSAPAAASMAGVPAAAVTPTAAGTAATPTAAAAAPVASEKVTVTTDLVKATFDTKGGDLVHLELLKFTDANDAKRPVVLFDQSAQRVYLAQTGLVTTQPGVSLPNHFSLMRLLPGERTLADGKDSLSISFESPDVGGVQLVKTYTFKRGDYPVQVTHTVKNNGSAPLSPQLYLQLARDGNPPPGESSF
jgi:YidC/Oxa1 family membrane protein insertase